ncbi:hypothetical protein ACWD6I_31535, partial [Streptomyces sp. NPDC002454]
MSSVTAGAGPGAEQDRPTLVMDVPSPLSSPPGRAGAVPGPVRWPEPSGVTGGVSAPVHLPSDISGRTSGGGQLPSHPGGHPVTRAPEYRTDHAYEHPGHSPAAAADRAAGRGALDAEGYPLPAPAGASSASSAPSEQSAPSGAGGPAGSSGGTAATAPASADVPGGVAQRHQGVAEVLRDLFETGAA